MYYIHHLVFNFNSVLKPEPVGLNTALCNTNVTNLIMFVFSVDQGYEHVEPLPDYVVVEESAPAEPQPPFTPQYATVETKSQDGMSVDEDYDDVEMPANYESEDYDDVG